MQKKSEDLIEYNKYIEIALDEADKEAENPETKRLTHEEVFDNIRKAISKK